MSRLNIRPNSNWQPICRAIARSCLCLVIGGSAFLSIPATVNADSSPHVGFFSPASVWTAAGNANLNLRQPDPRPGDLMIASIAIRPAASTVNTPSGWTLLDNREGTDGGAEGADTGSVRKYWFYKVATGSEGTANQTFTENGTTSVWNGSIMQVRSSTGTYDLSAGGGSINGDTTTWGGTLDADIGLTAGDLVILSTAVNGDLSNASAQNITATGVSTKSTVYEHGEFTSTTGNDIEQTLSSTLIWSGTNTVTPTTTHTKSAAASGVSSAIRIRQGAGSNRLDTWVRSAGSQVAGSTSVAARYPEHEVDDLLVLFVANRYDTATPATPSGWTSLGTYSGGAGTNGADAGTARVTAFYKQATTQYTGTQSVTVTGGNTNIAQMISVRKDAVDSWDIASDGGADNTADTSWSITGSGLELSSAEGGDIVLAASSINTDARLYSSYNMSATGVTFDNVTETAEYRSATGNDMTLTLATGRVSSGSGTAAPTLTSTPNGSTVNAPAGAAQFVKIIGMPPPSGSLGVDIVDSGGSSVASPSLNFAGLAASSSCQTSTATFGQSGQKIRLTNGTATPGWSLSIAASSGTGTNWNSGLADYDYNDASGGGCSDGVDGDANAGQLSVNPSGATITPEAGCTNSGISLSSSSGFSEGSIDSIAIATASPSAETDCYWDFTDIGLSQTIPSYQASGAYQLDITITTVAN